MSAISGMLRIGSWNYRSAAFIDREIEEEFDFHLACKVQDLVASGLTAEQAVQEANRQFGARDQIHRQCQGIHKGQSLWLIGTLALSFVVLFTTIGWLTMLLRTASLRNQQMMSTLALLQTEEETGNDLSGVVTNADAKPVTDAKVLLIHKSWPNGKYQQDALNTTTDEKGKFSFPKLYAGDEQNAFLVTILSEGQTMQSQYVLYKPNAKVKSFRFQLKPALEKTLVIHGADGSPLANALVYPDTRKPNKSKEEYHVYAQSADDAGFTTDDEGKVKMSLFEAGDTVQLVIDGSDPIKLVVDKNPEQTIKCKKK